MESSTSSSVADELLEEFGGCRIRVLSPAGDATARFFQAVSIRPLRLDHATESLFEQGEQARPSPALAARRPLS